MQAEIPQPARDTASACGGMIHGHYREEGIKNMLKLKKYTKKIFAGKSPQGKGKASRAIKSQLEDLFRSGLKSATPITVPLALISQIQRSGGSLLSQLFDGHPEIYAHPDELKIGYPEKYI
jgi:hypothetical protein